MIYEVRLQQILLFLSFKLITSSIRLDTEYMCLSEPTVEGSESVPGWESVRRRFYFGVFDGPVLYFVPKDTAIFMKTWIEYNH